MSVIRYTLLIAAFCFTTTLLLAQSIILDESFEDWEGVPEAYSAQIPATEGISSLKVVNDDRFLFVYVRFEEELVLQDGHEYRLLLDTDRRTSTGKTWQHQGQTLGVDISIAFGERTVTLYDGSSAQEFSTYMLGVVNAPTVSSKEFEVVLDMSKQVIGQSWIDTDGIGVAFVEYSSWQARTNAVEIRMSADTWEPAPFSFEKVDATDVRVMSYNVLFDNPFDGSIEPYFRRIFQAIQPDIISIQEVYNHSTQELANLLEFWIPTDEDQRWYHSGHRAGLGDNHLVSRYPIEAAYVIDKDTNAYIVDVLGVRTLVLVSHPPCCGNDDGRRVAFNNMMEFVKQVKNGQGPIAFRLQTNSPIIITGDMNLVRNSDQQRTLLHGEFTSVNGNPALEDFAPDWDGTSLEDAKSPNPYLPTTYTWHANPRDGDPNLEEPGYYSPGRLDYIVYTGSVLKMKRGFTLHTLAIPSREFNAGGAAEGLYAVDTERASDHLPGVADFDYSPLLTSVESPESLLPSSINLAAYPNPFNPSTNVTFSLEASSSITLEIVNILGQTLQSSKLGLMGKGVHKHQLSLEGYPSGMYYVVLRSGDKTQWIPVTMAS